MKLDTSDTFTKTEQIFTIFSKDRFQGGDEESLLNSEILL